MKRKWLRILGVLLILAGVAGLAFGGFEYTQEEKALDIGELEVEIETTEQVRVPPWLSGALLGLGVVLTVAGFRRR